MLTLLNHFDDLFMEHPTLRRRSTAIRTFVPAVDIDESEMAYHLTADLPGLSQDDLDISIDKGVLTFSGQRPASSQGDGSNRRRTERRHGAFRRAFTLPEGIDADGISAELANGQLRISIPKPVKSTPTKVQIQVPAADAG
jgi:HSP20 family protein